MPAPDAKRQRIVLAGDVPSPARPPPGCHFHTRCVHARPTCAIDAPALADDGAGHATACLFWRELPPPVFPAAESAPANVRLLRLQSAFVA